MATFRGTIWNLKSTLCWKGKIIYNTAPWLWDSGFHKNDIWHNITWMNCRLNNSKSPQGYSCDVLYLLTNTALKQKRYISNVIQCHLNWKPGNMCVLLICYVTTVRFFEPLVLNNLQMNHPDSCHCHSSLATMNTWATIKKPGPTFHWNLIAQ